MKKILLILVIALCSGMSAYAQVEIKDTDGQKYIGFEVQETKTHLIFVDEYNTEVKIDLLKVRSKRAIFCDIVLNNGLKFTANLKSIESRKLHFVSEGGEALEFTKFEFGAIIVNNRKLTSANWRPLSYRDLLLED